MNMLKILIIVTNVGVYANSNLVTGLGLSELTHLHHAANEKIQQLEGKLINKLNSTSNNSYVNH